MVFQNDDCLGYNTDYRAAMDCIEETFQIDKNQERPMQGLTALIPVPVAYRGQLHKRNNGTICYQFTNT